MLVTSFIKQENGNTTHSVEKYFHHFKRLRKSTQSNIILFLDESISPDLFKCDNTLVIPTSISQLESYSIINSCPSPIINFADNPNKNTKDFHIIMNSKTEFMNRALELTKDEQLAWVDFGIGHIISDENSFKKLDNIADLGEGIAIPGCWAQKTNIVNYPAWRFCGGFFAGDRWSIKKMHDLSTVVLKETLPQVTWEVNIWSIMESKYNFKFNWYAADHNDSIFNFK